MQTLAIRSGVNVNRRDIDTLARSQGNGECDLWNPRRLAQAIAAVMPDWAECARWPSLTTGLWCEVVYFTGGRRETLQVRDGHAYGWRR